MVWFPMAKHPQSPLSIMPSSASTAAVPPANFGPAGLNLWRSILAQYDIRDAGGLALLEQAALASDRAERLRAEIDGAGEILHTRNGPREHPGLKAELASRAFITRTLVKLGLNVEPLRSSPGRPPSWGSE
jgi:hypothetical protein